MMEWILTHAASSFGVVKEIITWSISNPGPSAFWGGVVAVLLNFVVKLTPTQIDDDILSAVSRAIREGIDNYRNTPKAKGK